MCLLEIEKCMCCYVCIVSFCSVSAERQLPVRTYLELEVLRICFIFAQTAKLGVCIMYSSSSTIASLADSFY